MIFKRGLSTTVLFLILLMNISATNYYCDPVNGSMSNEGTETAPWSRLQDVFEAYKSFSGEDTIFLMKGNHGRPFVFGRHDEYVVIMPYREDTAIMESVWIGSASYWELNGIHITSELPDGKNVYSLYYLVYTEANSDHLVISNCRIYSCEDTWDWTRDDWFNRTASGFMLKSTETRLTHNQIRNINFAIEVRGQHTVVERNLIENFVGDAIRGLASYCIYEYNVVRNAYDVTGYNPSNEGPGNHDDGFQSYTSAVGGVEDVIRRVTLRNNIFISYTDSSQTEKTMMQGIACFDGYYTDWVVENNLIVTDSWHGISFLGLKHSKVANNTILSNPVKNPLTINNSPVDEMTPWIWIAPLKEDRGDGPSTDNIIRNNLVIQSKAGLNGYQNIYDQGVNTVVQNNITVPTGGEGDFFRDPGHLDYQLAQGSPAIDAGINIDLPMTDLVGQARLSGMSVDAGAYEYDDGNATAHAPLLYPIPDTSVREGDTLALAITAGDADGDALTFSVSPVLPFITLTCDSNGQATLTARPAAGHQGTYSLALTVTDGTFENSRNFLLVVQENPNLAVPAPGYGSILLYPNPVTKGHFFLRNQDRGTFKPVKLMIFDMTGKMLTDIPLMPDSGNVIQIKLPTKLQDGIYLVNIISAKGERITRTLVVRSSR